MRHLYRSSGKILPVISAALAAAMLLLSSPAARAQAPAAELPELNISTYPLVTPSGYLTALVKELKLDEKYGFRLKAVHKPGPVAYNDFATGKDLACHCVGIVVAANIIPQGVDVSLLWHTMENQVLFVSGKKLTSPTDLYKANIGGDTSTGSIAVGLAFLELAGLDVSKLKIRSITSGPANVAELTAGRIDATLLIPDDFSELQVRSGEKYFSYSPITPEFLTQKTGAGGIPNWGFAVHRKWLDDPKNVELARKFYQATKEAVDLVKKDPVRAAELITNLSGRSKEALVYSFKNFPDQFQVRPSREYRESFKLLTQEILPKAKQVSRALTDAELDRYLADAIR